MIPGSSPSKRNVPELSGYPALLRKSRACFRTPEPLGSWPFIREYFTKSLCHPLNVNISERGV